ncbi:hypothetical protein GCM10008938_39470 [Deinococcus roseus]|uniref:Thioredoxin-like fold domain-containing protein n=2 Tax=Deinococcus roseus TaxID=392414 RepID=A0ABQ2DA10_9DEIO|nr:hypothetical protein GCM10008938_39470 [Deinococcus roseus]
MRDSSWFGLFFSLVLLLLMGGSAGVYSEVLEDQKQALKEAFLNRVPMWGNRESKIVLVEFADLNCSDCKTLHQTVFQKTIEYYVQSGRAVYYFVDVGMLGKDSAYGTRFSYCLQKHDPQQIQTFIDRIYATPGQHWNASKYHSLYLSMQGQHLPEIKRCTGSRAAQAFLEENQRRMKKSQVQQVPALSINDRLYPYHPKAVERGLQDLSGWLVSSLKVQPGHQAVF